MRFDFESIEYNSIDACEIQAILVLNDFLSNRIDNDNIVFYPIDTDSHGHADVDCGIEKKINGRLTVNRLRFECKSAKYKEKGIMRFSKYQIHNNTKRLTILILKGCTQIDSIRVGYLDTQRLVDKNIVSIEGNGNYKYNFDKEKSSLITQNIFYNNGNGHKVEMSVIAIYNSNDIKELVDFYNACNSEERKEYLNILSIKDLIEKEKADNYNELTYNSLKGMMKC